MEHVSTIGLLCTCATCLLLPDTLLHPGKAETTSLDETGDDIVLSEQEVTEDNNKQDTTLENPQKEDLGVEDNIDTFTEAVGKMSVSRRSHNNQQDIFNRFVFSVPAQQL